MLPGSRQGHRQRGYATPGYHRRAFLLRADDTLTGWSYLRQLRLREYGKPAKHDTTSRRRTCGQFIPAANPRRGRRLTVRDSDRVPARRTIQLQSPRHQPGPSGHRVAANPRGQQIARRPRYPGRMAACAPGHTANGRSAPVTQDHCGAPARTRWPDEPAGRRARGRLVLAQQDAGNHLRAAIGGEPGGMNLMQYQCASTYQGT